jgi:hypothetical protein
VDYHLLISRYGDARSIAVIKVDRWKAVAFAALASVASVLASSVHGTALDCASLLAGSLAGLAAYSALPKKKSLKVRTSTY